MLDTVFYSRECDVNHSPTKGAEEVQEVERRKDEPFFYSQRGLVIYYGFLTVRRAGPYTLGRFYIFGFFSL